MSIKETLTGIFQDRYGSLFDILNNCDGNKLLIELFAIERAKNLISNMISKTELKVYKQNSEKKIEPVKDELYYRINIKPNENETGTSFLKKIVNTLLKNQEVLVISMERSRKKVPYLYVAESFDKSNDIINSKEFTNIKLSDGDNELELKKTFDYRHAMYLKLQNGKLEKYLKDFCDRYEKILRVAYMKYKSDNTTKWRLKNPGTSMALKDPTSGKEISYEEYKKKITEGLFNDEESVVMLSEQFNLEKLTSEKATMSEDYRNMEKDIFNNVAMAFDIPLDVYYGTKTEKSGGTNDFITQACEPIMENIEDAMNDAYVSEKCFIKGEKIAFDKFNMKHADITELASSLEKLVGIGFSHNDILGFLKMPNIDDDWANEHKITKNFGNMKGGAEENE